MALISTSIGQIELHTWGRGSTTIVLLHAAASGPRALVRLAERLAAAGHRVVAPALAGYGATAAGDIADAVLAHVAVARAVLDLESGVPCKVLFGHSMGGLVALRSALTRTDLDAVIAYEPVAFGVLDRSREPDASAADWDRRIADTLITKVDAGDNEAGVAAFVEAWNEVAWPSLPEAARKALVDAAPRLRHEVACVTRDRVGAHGYASLGDRLTLLRGSRSPAAARLIAERIAAAAPGSRLIESADGGHMAPVLNSDSIAMAVLAAIAATRSA